MATHSIEVCRRGMLLGTMAASNNRAVHLELLCNQLRETLTQGTAIEAAMRFIVRRSEEAAVWFTGRPEHLPLPSH